MSRRRVRSDHISPSLTPKVQEVHARTARGPEIHLGRPPPYKEAAAEVSALAFLGLPDVVVDLSVSRNLSVQMRSAHPSPEHGENG